MENKQNTKDSLRTMITQKALIYDFAKEKFLLAKVADQAAWYFKNLGPWEPVGGGLNEDEALQESIVREVSEEIGSMNFEILSIVGTHEFVGRSGKKVMLIYLAKYLDGEVTLSGEHSEYKWVSAEEVEKGKEYKEWLKSSVRKASEYIEREKALDSWKRCQADFENYKKSQAAHQEEFRKYAKMDVTLQILPVLDNFEASLAHVPESEAENKWVEGIVFIKKQLADVLKNNNIEEIEVKVGDKFNPEIHEAIGGDGEKQKIKTVVQKGYRLNGRTLRAARVEVE